MKKLYALGAVALLVTATVTEVTISTVSNQSSTIVYAASKSSKKTKTRQAEKKLRKNYDSIVTGDMLSSGDGGSTTDEVVALLGNPTSTNSDDSTGVVIDTYTWEKGNTTVAISFTDGKVTNKDIYGFEYKRKATVGLTKYNNLQLNTSYDDVIKAIGKPDIYSEYNISGETTISAYWTSGLKAKNKKKVYISLTFTNGVLTDKRQKSLK